MTVDEIRCAYERMNGAIFWKELPPEAIEWAKKETEKPRPTHLIFRPRKQSLPYNREPGAEHEEK